jgi:hypothetical protein
MPGLLDGTRTCPLLGGDASKPFNGNGAAYRDNVERYLSIEPALDLAAATMRMSSWRIAGVSAGAP